MNDRELADAVVALGVAKRYPDESEWWVYWFDGAGSFSAKEFVRDWRVAGKMIEKVDGVYVEALFGGGCFQVQVIKMDCESTDWHEDLSTPRAIIEACVEALK